MRTMSPVGMTMIWLLASAASAAAGGASASVDSRWIPWLGCWQQIQDTVRNESVPDALADTEPVTTDGVVVCVTPADDPAGVVFTTSIEQQSSVEETVVADGSSRPISEPGCEGSQRARWSENGRRLFARADLSCAGGKREVSGLTTIAPGGLWVDVQVATADGRESIRVRRYRRAIDHSRVAARVSPDLLQRASAAARLGVPFSIEEVKEASAKVSPSTVEAALIETDASFPLNGARMLELDAAGVPDRVLDLMVALSFPNKFIIERRTPPAIPTAGTAYGPWSWMGGGGYDLWPYYYAPFGYARWGLYDLYPYGYYDYYGYSGPLYAVDTPSPGVQASGQGRVVDGMGYTRVRAREPQGNPGGFFGGGSSSGGGGGSSGGTVSTSGYSSGGGGGDGGRTAQARPPQ